MLDRILMVSFMFSLCYVMAIPFYPYGSGVQDFITNETGPHEIGFGGKTVRVKLLRLPCIVVSFHAHVLYGNPKDCGLEPTVSLATSLQPWGASKM